MVRWWNLFQSGGAQVQVIKTVENSCLKWRLKPGPDLADERLIESLGPLSHCCGVKMEKYHANCEKPKMTILPSKSTVNKNSKALLECPTIIAFVAAFDTKAFNDNGIVEIVLGWREQHY